MNRLRRLTAISVLALVVVACGGNDDDGQPLAKVDVALAPTEVVDGKLKLFENTDDATRIAFAEAPDDSLLADGRLWELRRAERLVGTLQISTVIPRVDLTDERQRSTIVNEILVADPTRIRVNDIEVSTSVAGDRAIYVWFGDGVLSVLTVRGFDEIEPEQVLASVLDHQTRSPVWQPLPDATLSTR